MNAKQGDGLPLTLHVYYTIIPYFFSMIFHKINGIKFVIVYEDLTF